MMIVQKIFNSCDKKTYRLKHLERSQTDTKFNDPIERTTLFQIQSEYGIKFLQFVLRKVQPKQ